LEEPGEPRPAPQLYSRPAKQQLNTSQRLNFFGIFDWEPQVCGRVIRMSLPSPWSVKGVQPRTREAAKDLARREGLTLGEWLNRLIGDVDEDGNTDAPGDASYDSQQIPENRRNSALQTPPQQAQQIYREELPLAPFPNSSRETHRDNDNSRLTAALEQLTRRLDSTLVAPPPVYPPIAPQQSYAAPEPASAPPSFAAAGLMDRLEATERLAETAVGRVDASLADVRQTQAALGERLRIMEANDPTNKSLSALRGLETALNRLSEQVFDTQTRTQTLDTNFEQMSQRLANTESMAGATSGRLAEAMVDLSARLTGVEQTQDDQTLKTKVSGLNDRLSGMEDLTTQAIESVDKGLGLVSQRVAATEALAQATNERLVEALIDLSARLVQLESIDSQEEARDLLSAIEAKNKELTRRLEALDNKIDATRSDLTTEVKSAVATGVDGRMAEIAKALADRLDMSERRNGEALEKIGAEMARASISLDQRLREIEERGTEDIAESMRNEMAKMGRSIDERMASMERRDAAALDQAGGHIKQLAQSLTERLDASEARAQSAVHTVSSQMEQLALRLQTRQDETAKNLVARMEDGEARGNQELKSSIEQIATEIRSAEDRAKAVAAPLHRDFSSLVDRLDQIESSGMSPYAETVSNGDQSVTLGDVNQRHREAFGTPATAENYGAGLVEDYTAQTAFDAQPESPSPRRAGFGSPFPGSDPSHEDANTYAAPNQDGEHLEAPLAGSTFDEFDEGSFLAEETNSTAPNSFQDDSNFGDDFGNAWEDEGRAPRGGNDYLANARLAATRAAAERAAAQPIKKKPLLGASKKKSAKGPMISTITDTSGRTTKAKPALSPVGMVAAAALVVTTGVMAVNYFNRDKSQDEKPNSLNVAPNPVAPTPVAPSAVAPSPVAPTNAVEAPSIAPVTVVKPVAVPGSTAPKAASAVPQAVQPSGNTIVQEAPAPTTYVPRPAVTKPSAQMRQFQTAENNRAAQAAARSQVAKARMKSVTPTPPREVVAPVRTMASIDQSSISPRIPARTPTPVAVPFNVPVAPSATAPRNALPVATRAAPTQPSAVATPPRVATFAAPVAPRAQAVNTPTARAPAPRTPAPRVASTPPIGPVTSANVRQAFDQAVAKQQAGDLAGAAALMRAAADTGDARSLQRLAKMYERGEGVARDPAQARALTERAATRGNSQAMHNLGVYYAEGEGAGRDMNKAAENFRRAANRGVTDSQFNLGAMAEQGLGGEKSEREAYYWYSIAGRSGDRDAAAKSRELGARLPAAEKAAEDRRAAQFRPEPSNGN
jgi:localization factor PodJL